MDWSWSSTFQIVVLLIFLEPLPEPLMTDSDHYYVNKANLRDLIAATGLVILLKLDSNCRFFSSCDLEI